MQYFYQIERAKQRNKVKKLKIIVFLILIGVMFWTFGFFG
jgi:dipeptide/tripeptide permease